MVLFHECLIHILDFWFVVPWDHVSEFSFTMPFWSGFWWIPRVAKSGAVNSFPTLFADKHGIICMDLEGMFAIQLVWSVCLDIEVSWSLGSWNILQKSCQWNPCLKHQDWWGLSILRVPKKKLPKYLVPASLSPFFWGGVLTCPFKKTAPSYLDPYGVTLVAIDLFKRSPFSEASTPNAPVKGRPWECHITTKS